jgi:hypothetical protein
MRIAAGVILIILSVFGLSGLVFFLSELMIRLPSVPLSAVFSILWYIVPAAFYVIGGVFCFRKKYWRVCLASASFAVLVVVFVVVEPFVMLGRFAMPWIAWVAVIGAIISTIFISLSRKGWQGISDSMDGKVSYDG